VAFNRRPGFRPRFRRASCFSCGVDLAGRRWQSAFAVAGTDARRGRGRSCRLLLARRSRRAAARDSAFRHCCVQSPAGRDRSRFRYGLTDVVTAHFNRGAWRLPESPMIQKRMPSASGSTRLKSSNRKRSATALFLILTRVVGSSDWKCLTFDGGFPTPICRALTSKQSEINMLRRHPPGLAARLAQGRGGHGRFCQCQDRLPRPRHDSALFQPRNLSRGAEAAPHPSPLLAGGEREPHQSFIFLKKKQKDAVYGFGKYLLTLTSLLRWLFCLGEIGSCYRSDGLIRAGSQ
jgi:hypothetical protein